mmetsp:Transcript_23048/g.75139  ORF Transcript_23048/g.75139 Transcript_23048/m.75139 type:complete len:313 (-) Transcript_23048:55-993(-)
MRPHHVLVRLHPRPRVAVPVRTFASHLVESLDALEVVFRNALHFGGVGHEKRVVRVACGVLLRLDERVEVPERRFHKVVRRHLLEPELEKDVPELLSHLEERVEVASARRLASKRRKVVRLKLRRLPRPVREHVSRELRLLLLALERKLGPFAQAVRSALPQREQLALLLQHVKLFLRRQRGEVARRHRTQHRAHGVVERGSLAHHPRRPCALVQPHQLQLHRLLEPHVCHPFRQRSLELVQRHALVALGHRREHLRLRRASLQVPARLRRELPKLLLLHLCRDELERCERSDCAHEGRVLDAQASGERAAV